MSAAGDLEIIECASGRWSATPVSSRRRRETLAGTRVHHLVVGELILHAGLGRQRLVGALARRERANGRRDAAAELPEVELVVVEIDLRIAQARCDPQFVRNDPEVTFREYGGLLVEDVWRSGLPESRRSFTTP